MLIFIALLRAVNIGGTGKLPMSDLKTMCDEIGFAEVQTYIASGNVVFKSNETADKVKMLLEAKLQAYAGKPVGVHVRTLEEMAQVLADNPYADEAPNRTLVIFLDSAPPADAIEKTTGLQGEKLQLGKQEIYAYYGEGMADSKLKIPAAKTGTARNINTVKKLLEIAEKKKGHAP